MTMSPTTPQRAQIAGPAGSLEVLVEPGAEPAGPLCVICHPHPQYGGTLDNKVVYTLARAAKERGATAVRFNFRGVGQSAGEFGQGVGEVDDLLAVVAWARAAYPRRQLHLAGFSFGAAMALKGHALAHAASLLLVAPPAGMGYLEQVATPLVPWRVIHGGRDELIGLDVLQRWLMAVADGPPPLSVIDAADHFFHGQLTALREAASTFWAPLMGSVGTALP